MKKSEIFQHWSGILAWRARPSRLTSIRIASRWKRAAPETKSRPQRPLAIVVIGGLLISTLLTLVRALLVYSFFEGEGAGMIFPAHMGRRILCGVGAWNDSRAYGSIKSTSDAEDSRI
jgi:hypothetical protein